MTIAVPVLLAIIGIALIIGHKSPPWITAAVFLVIGMWVGQTWFGEQILTQFDQLTRAIG